MSIYDEIEEEIMTMRISTGKGNGKGKKLYKPLLILSMLDYHYDKGDESKAFNNPTPIDNIADFFIIYLENELIREETYNDKSNRFDRSNIIKVLRESPLYHLVFTGSKMKEKPKKTSNFFDNDLDDNIEKKPGAKDAATLFEIKVPQGINLMTMANRIRSACYERIRIETNIVIKQSVAEAIANDKSEDFSIDDTIVNKISKAKSTKETYVRIGQYLYRQKMLEKYNCKCAFCNFDVKHTLISSHAKPWRDCESAEEKLSEDNGFLLCATHDKMFDQGYISINVYTGEFIFSKELRNKEFKSCKSTLPKKLDFEINNQMKNYLEYHSEKIFKGI